MPFTGTGTGIANANDIFFSGLGQDQVLRYNSATSKWNNAALSVTTSLIADDAVTEPKIAISNSPSNNQFLRWNGTALEWASLSYEATITAGTTSQYWRGDKSWQTLDKTAVGLGNVDNTSDANKPVSTATQTALADKVDKTMATTKGDLLVATASSSISRLGVGTDSYVLTADSAQATGIKWAAIPADAVTSVAGRSGVVTLTKSDVGLANVDNTSDANKPVSTATQTALNAKATTTTTVSGTNSISGGGDLSANRTLALVNDAASPGNSKYYGTDGTGVRGFFNLSVANPTMGGDLTGTASNAQLGSGVVDTTELATDAVATAKIADSAVTEPKLAVSNSPSTGQVLAWNGSAMAWSPAFSFTKVSITSSYTANAYEYIFADASTTGITVTLPAPQANAYVRVKRMSSGANGVQVVAPGGSYIDSLSVGSDVMNNQFDSSEYWSDGSNWYR